MADFNLPDNLTTYTSVLSTLRSEIASVAKMDFTGDTNLPTNTIRLTTSTGLVESWNGSAWVVKGYILTATATGLATSPVVLNLAAVSAPSWTTASFLWSESGFGTRYDGYQHRFDVGNARTAAMNINTSGYTTFGAATSGSSIVNIYGGVLNAGAVSGAYAGFRFTLDPAQTTYNSLHLEHLNGNSHYIMLKRHSATAGTLTIGTADADDLVFRTSNVDRGRVTAAGYLLMGYSTSNGAYFLQVNSQIFATNATIATSDGRYKEDVQEVQNALDLVSALKPVSFNWKEHPVHNFPKERDIGFIAQDVQDVLKDTSFADAVVRGNETTLPDGEKEEFLGLADSKLVPLLVGAIKELNAKVEALTARVAELEATR